MEIPQHSLISELPKIGKRRKFKNKKRKSFKKSVKKLILGHRDVNTFMQEMAQNTSLNAGPAKSENSNMGLLNQTIDLCDDDSPMLNADSLNIQNKPPNLTCESNMIDLSKEVNDSDEVIVLSENSKLEKTLETTVIDLCDEESVKSNNNTISDSDDIFVIGTFSNYTTPKNMLGSLPEFIPLPAAEELKSKKSGKRKKFRRKFLRKAFPKQSPIVNGNQSVTENSTTSQPESSSIGENIYTNSPVELPKSGLRPIIIDGSNVAYGNSKRNFSVKRIEICIKYFKEKGHKVTAFLPQFRIKHGKSDNSELLQKLVDSGDVVLTPSKVVDGKSIVPYDDRFIVQTAVLKGGVIISRDNYLDLLKENPAWGETIKYRTLAFTWVDDVLMFPKDPLGENGPSLEEFLRFH